MAPSYRGPYGTPGARAYERVARISVLAELLAGVTCARVGVEGQGMLQQQLRVAGIVVGYYTGQRQGRVTVQIGGYSEIPLDDDEVDELCAALQRMKATRGRVEG